MTTEPLFSASYFVILGVLCGVVGFRIGWRTGNRFVLPVFQGLAGWVAFLYAWWIHGPATATAAVGCWAVATTLVSLYFFVGQPRETEERVLRAAVYRETMLDWLRAGHGPEARPLAMVRTHIHELAIYVTAATLTANVVSLVLGAVLLNSMNAWVATMFRAARRTGIVVLLGWPPWSVFRVAAYLAIGTAAAAPLMARLGYAAPPGSIRPLAFAGVAGILLDLALKRALSRRWGRLLAEAVDLDAAASNRRREVSFHLDLAGPGPDPGTGDGSRPDS